VYGLATGAVSGRARPRLCVGPAPDSLGRNDRSSSEQSAAPYPGTVAN
jgi:hypothetical protein